MARDQVKTQVLLLHSEQHTLDNLSSGLDDRYTVHCATTGTEALNTLGDTPIHVIVSAKDLPGMSGVEALREAKKRSPETIGILLAGENEQGLEALVGEKEVFQVVRGSLTATELTALIDNATRQMRLLALAESANDTAADPDNLAAQHIVMETSENGSTIISDGTGKVPVLDPTKISSNIAAGARAVDVLVLTKDEEFLATVKESTRGLHNVHYANTLAQAEEAIAKHKVGVGVVDAAMVGENVEKLTQHLRRKSTRLVNIVAGRRDDGEMLMDLINRGKVYRFLLKPVSPGRARLAIEASVKHHLEAPDSAFKLSGHAPAGKSAPASKPAAAPAARPAPKAASKTPAASSAAAGAPDLMGDNLNSAFDGDDSSFTETMTGIVSNLGKAISGKINKGDDAAETKPAAATSRASAPAAAPATPELSANEPLGMAMSDSGDTSSFAGGKIIGIGAVVAVVLVAAGIWMFGGFGDDDSVDRPSSARTSVTESQFLGDGTGAPPAKPVPARNELRQEAQLAYQAGQIFNPPGNNALELYAAAVAASPGNADIAAEFANVVNDALQLAETAMLERRIGDAEAALDRVAFADPANSRLPFLTAQLSQMQLRDYIDSARAAIRETRFEDASNALAAAAALGISQSAELAAVNAELAEARSEQRADEVLAQAAMRLEQNKLIAPSNDNARYFYELVLSSDPQNLAAQQGLTTIASKLVLQARSEIDQGRFESANNLLADARQLDSANADLAGATQALADARDRVVAEERRREAERAAALQRAEEQRIAAEEQAAAEREAAAAPAEPATDQATETTPASVASTAPPASSPSATDAPGNRTASAPKSDSPLPISALKRLKYVAPKYPRVAERRNLSGWVDIVFTVAADGTTSNIEVRGSEPENVFVDAAVTAVEKWEFEPIVENGFIVQKQAGVRMMFALE